MFISSNVRHFIAIRFVPILRQNPARIEESTSRIFGRVGRRNNFFLFFSPPSGIRIISPPPIEGVTSFDRERSFDPLFGAVVTPFDRNHSIRYGRLNPAAALAPFHIPLSSVNLPTCFKPSLSPPLRVSFAPVRVPIDGER